MKENILKLSSLILNTKLERGTKAIIQIDYGCTEFWLNDAFSGRVFHTFELKEEKDIDKAIHLIKAYKE